MHFEFSQPKSIGKPKVDAAAAKADGAGIVYVFAQRMKCGQSPTTPRNIR
jgi:hypothetical protein